MKVDVLSLKLTVACFTVESHESGHPWDQEIDRCLVILLVKQFWTILFSEEKRCLKIKSVKKFEVFNIFTVHHKTLK